MGTLTHKGYGRIYVETREDIDKVKAIIKEIDEFEFGYLPRDIIAVYTEYPKVVYNGKFSDLDMDVLTAKCWDSGIKIWVFNSGEESFPEKGWTDTKIE